MTHDPRAPIFRPDEAAQIAARHVEKAMHAAQSGTASGSPLGIPNLDGYFAPLEDGQTLAIVGLPSNGKSLLLRQLCANAAERIAPNNPPDDFREAVVKVSVEDYLETQVIREAAVLADEDPRDIAQGRPRDIHRVLAAFTKLTGVPLFYVSASIQERERNVPLHLSNIEKSLDLLVEKFKLRIRLLAVDYLQKLPLDPDNSWRDQNSRRLQVMRDVDRLFRMAGNYGCPLVCAVQAKQTQFMKGRLGELFLPNGEDAEETHSIDQYFDRIVGVAMPKRQKQAGSIAKVGETHFMKIEENTFLLRVDKQRGDLPAGAVFYGYVDFVKKMVVIRPYEEVTRQVLLNKGV